MARVMGIGAVEADTLMKEMVGGMVSEHRATPLICTEYEASRWTRNLVYCQSNVAVDKNDEDLDVVRKRTVENCNLPA
jgi:hypothetical protein